MAKQQTLFSFFPKEAVSKTNAVAKSKTLKLKGIDLRLHDLAWAKLDGYPWWPALVCLSPTDNKFIRRNMVHVQFFDDPPTRGWVKDSFIKPFGPPEKCGLPVYTDAAWEKAFQESTAAAALSLEERKNLVVEMTPSDSEEMEDEESDKSKENIDINVKGHKRKSEGLANGSQQSKKQKVVIVSDSELSEDEYKPGDQEESDDESVSSGVNENEIPEPETESEVDSPVKKIKKVRASRVHESKQPQTPKSSLKNVSFNSPVSEATKSKLATFAAKEAPVKSSEDGGNWPHTTFPFLKAENICDRERRRPDHPDYDPRTLYVPPDFLNKQTPAMRQWWELKSQYYDTVLFFKMGKFYELFNMDAVLAVQELGLLMMKGECAHSGFPEISYGRFSSCMIEKGYKVARIEQMETPEMMEKRCKAAGKVTKFDKVVKREVCQVTTRGTRVPSFLDADSSTVNTSYLLSVTERKTGGPGELCQFGVAFIDSGIGKFHVGQFVDDRHISRLRTLLAHFPPGQILYEKGMLSEKSLRLLKCTVPASLLECLVPEKEFWTPGKTLEFLNELGCFKCASSGKNEWPEDLKKMIDLADPSGLTPIAEYELSLSAFGALCWYLKHCFLHEDMLSRKCIEEYLPPDAASDVDSKERVKFTKHMVLDGSALRNLEVLENSNGGLEGTLLERLDNCQTSFGKRLLLNWICSPLCSPDAINVRLDAVEELREKSHLLEPTKQMLKELPDLEKLIFKIHSQGLRHNDSHPNNRAIFFEEQQYSKRKVVDLLTALSGFKSTIAIVEEFRGMTSEIKSSLLHQCVYLRKDNGHFPELNETLDFFANAFDHEEAKKEGKIYPCKGVDPEYDAAVKKIEQAKSELDKYLKEQAAFFCCKVTFFGSDKKRYQIEVPEHNSRKATGEHELVSQRKGYKRYWTPTAKHLLAEVMAGEDLKNAALKDIARRIFEQFDSHYEEWRSALECISVLDVLLSLAQYSRQSETTRPVIVLLAAGEKPFLDIRDGKHPCCVSTFSGGDFIPNDIVLGKDSEDSHACLVLVTGPNMGGKSTLMRQTGLICLLAQMGSFVPASLCHFTVVDRIFTRIGAWDRILMGESTFYVELAETASIMQHANEHSLVLIDELGRGTATYDGTAIASSVVDNLVKKGSRTLFSTHYHSLVDDFKNVGHVSLGHMACMVEGESEDGDPSQESIIFLYKFTEGACPKSYGFNAARLADLPDSVIRRASEKARELEMTNERRKKFLNFICSSGISEAV